MKSKRRHNKYLIQYLRLYVLLVVSLVLLSACKEQKLTLVPEDGVILAFGDSLTAGVGGGKGGDYPTFLSELSKRRVVNAGISGETTKRGRTRFLETLQREKPHLVLLLEGGNDILRSLDLRETKGNLAAMIEMAKGEGVDVVLIGVPEKKLFAGVTPLYEELADEYNLVFEADLIGNLLRKPQYKSDMIHFNESGYYVMAESLYELLKKNGAL